MNHSIDFVSLVEEIKPFIKEVSIEEVKNKLKINNDFVLIDVREDHEWQQGHIPKAIHIARGILERDINNKLKDKNTEVILYCGGGYRSALSAYNLQKMGFKNVASMAGGIKDWLIAGYAITLK